MSGQSRLVITGHMHVAQLALRSGEYHAVLRNLIFAQNGAEEMGLPLSSEEDATLQRLMGKAHLGLGEYKNAQNCFERALEIDTGRGALAGSILSDTRHVADCLTLEHNFEAAKSLYAECISKLESASDMYDRDFQLAKAYIGLVSVLIDSKALEGAQQILALALDLFLRHDGPRGFWYGRALTVLAKLQDAQMDTELAEQTLTQALQILETQIGPEHPLRAALMKQLELIARDKGDEFNVKNLGAAIANIDQHLRQHDV